MYKRTAGAGAVLVVLAGLAGWGPAPVSASSTPPVKAAGTVAPTYQDNRLASQLEASHLLALAPLPPGAARDPSPSAAGLALGLMGRPKVVTLITRSEAWTVPQPLAEVRAWLAAHPPRHLQPSGTSTGSTGTVLVYSAQVAPAWALAQLGVAATAAGAARSVVSLGAQVVPIDPVPLPDNTEGERVRVTLSGGCPALGDQVVGVTNPGAGLTDKLLPATTPTAGLVCTYAGSAGPPALDPGGPMMSIGNVHGSRGTPRPATRSGRGPLHQVKLGAVAAGQLAARVNALPLGHVVGQVFSCPADNGSVAIAVFSYSSQPDVDLWVNLTGCGGVANGYIRAGTGTLGSYLQKIAGG